MLKIEIITSQKKWDSFLIKQEHSNILQSYSWGEFQKALGRKIWRLGVFEEKKIVGVALAQYIPTRLRSHIYISNGPVILPQYFESGLNKLVGYTKAIALQVNAKFVRLDPLWEDDKKNNRILRGAKLQKAKTHIQAENKWILDISKDEETLLKEMDKNTRYEIKKSEKEGVTFHTSTNMDDFPKFETLFQETVKRQKFIPNPKAYYQKQFEILSSFNNYKIVWAQKDEQVISVALIGIFGDSAFYLHAASLNNREINKLMGPQAVVWGSIKMAKELNCKYFDFWGVAPTDDPKDQWAGFTRFKKGFGGYMFKTVRAHDLPISPEYFVISMLEKYREVWGIPYFKLLKLLKK
jgi:lipid II:glycine glycyltransferase (peptidoglycan interpeptide bridge formation enzyme)